MKKYIALLRAEMLKIKGTFAIWLSVIGASLVVVLWFCILFFKANDFAKVFSKGNPWDFLITNCFAGVEFFLLPLYIVLLNSLVLQIEHKAFAWKSVLAMPVKRSQVFISKLVIILVLIFLTHLLFAFEILMTGKILGILKPVLPFTKTTTPYLLLLKITLKSFVSILALCVLQFWLSIRIKNFIVPLGIGLAGTVTAGILWKWKKSIFIPYALPILNFTGSKPLPVLASHSIPMALFNSLWIFVLIFILSVWDFRRMQVK